MRIVSLILASHKLHILIVNGVKMEKIDKIHKTFKRVVTYTPQIVMLPHKLKLMEYNFILSKLKLSI